MIERDKKAALKKRAQDISRAKTLKIKTEREISIMDFRLAGEVYALETPFIRKVLPAVDIIKVPGAPNFLMGLFNNRGSIFSVVDLRVLFNIASREVGAEGKWILLSGHDMEFAVYADSIGVVRSVQESSLVKTLPVLASFPPGYVKGMTAEREIILDAEVILKDEGLRICDYVD